MATATPTPTAMARTTATATAAATKADIAAVDTAEVKTFEGGCCFLRNWYR